MVYHKNFFLEILCLSKNSHTNEDKFEVSELKELSQFFYNLQQPLVFWCVRRDFASRKKIAGRFSEPGPGASELP